MTGAEETKPLDAAAQQQLAAKALGQAIAECIRAMQSLEAIHPVASNSDEFKQIKKLSVGLREAMMAVLQMKVR